MALSNRALVEQSLVLLRAGLAGQVVALMDKGERESRLFAHAIARFGEHPSLAGLRLQQWDVAALLNFLRILRRSALGTRPVRAILRP